jgi:HAD superfamily hydrolase (TIGR01490 family)
MDKNARSYIAFFDLDKTILSINSGKILVRIAYKRGLMKTADLLNAIWLSGLYKFNLKDTTLIISGMGKWLKGQTVNEMNTLSKHIVNEYLIDTIRPEILSEIKFHREHNAGIVILSSVMLELCRPVGYHLGADNCICTNMEIADGVYTGLPENKFCFGDEKRVQLLEYCDSGNYNTGEAWYYGDSIADIHALEAVGHPVCVSPDKKLTKIARERGWRVL